MPHCVGLLQKKPFLSRSRTRYVGRSYLMLLHQQVFRVIPNHDLSPQKWVRNALSRFRTLIK